MKARLVRLRYFVLTNAFLLKSCLFVDLVCFFSLLLRVAVFLNVISSLILLNSILQYWKHIILAILKGTKRELFMQLTYNIPGIFRAKYERVSTLS